MHPLLEQFCRAAEFRPEFLRRCQREFREQLAPLLDERDRVLAENIELKARIDALETELAQAQGKVRRREAAAV